MVHASVRVRVQRAAGMSAAAARGLGEACAAGRMRDWVLVGNGRGGFEWRGERVCRGRVLREASLGERERELVGLCEGVEGAREIVAVNEKSSGRVIE